MEIVEKAKKFKDDTLAEEGAIRYFRMGFMIIITIALLFGAVVAALTVAPYVGFALLIVLGLVVLGWIGEKVWELFVDLCKRNKEDVKADTLSQKDDVIITPPPPDKKCLTETSTIKKEV